MRHWFSHALDAREAEWPEAVDAIRLLALTGCRRNEVLNLRWRDIGADAINLRDSKSRRCAVLLGEAARSSHLVEAAEKVGAIIATAMTSQHPRPIIHRQ